MSEDLKNNYLEIGIIDQQTYDTIHKYVTELHVVKGGLLRKEFVDFIKKVHGDDILISFTEKEGSMPDNVDLITIDIPEPELKYGRNFQ